MSEAHTTFQTGHIGLNVSNLGRSKAFYQQVFGFQIVTESEAEERKFALLGEEGNVVLTLWQQSTGSFSRNQPGLHHLAFMVKHIDDVVHLEKRLRDMKVHLIYDGIVPHSEGAHSGGIFFEDPDGIRLEVFSPSGAEGHEVPSDGPSCGFF